MESPHEHLHKISIPDTNGFNFINVLDIIYCSADGSYVQFCMKGETKNVLATMLLTEVEQQLIKYDFMMRIHKSHIVNLNFASHFVKGKDGTLILENKMSLPVSRNYKKEFLRKWGRG